MNRVYIASAIVIALVQPSVSADSARQKKQAGVPAELIGYFTDDVKYCPGNFADSNDNRIEIDKDFMGSCAGSWCGSELKSFEKTLDGYKLYAVGEPTMTKFTVVFKIIDNDHVIIDPKGNDKDQVLTRCEPEATYKAKLEKFKVNLAPPGVFGTTCKADYSSYEKLDIGVSYNQAVSIIGCAGKETAASKTAEHFSKMYGWDGDGTTGANLQVLFLDDSISSKSQVGLR